jgi:polyisoprenoid-binding protein YceI
MRKQFMAVLVASGVALSGLVSHAGSHDEEYAGAAYKLDKDHTSVGFRIRHMGITNVRGHFNEYDGKLKLNGDDITSLVVKATIKAASIDTNNDRRDDHLRSADFFEVETYPEITFHSREVVAHGGGYALVGDMTIKDVTKEVKLPVTLSGPAEDPWGNTRIGLEITGAVDRNDFGVAFDGAADRMIGAMANFDINIQAIKE